MKLERERQRDRDRERQRETEGERQIPLSLLFEQIIITTLQRKEPLQTQKPVALRRFLGFHHQTRLNHLNHD